MGVSQELTNCGLFRHLHTPKLCVCHEEKLIVGQGHLHARARDGVNRALVLVRFKRIVDATRICQVFSQRVQAILAKRLEVINEAIGLFLESACAGIAPPVVKRAGRVVFAALIVKAVGYFVANYGANCA